MKNLEVKGIIHDRIQFEEMIRDAGGVYSALLRQEDTYFHTPRGRLKVRSFSPDSGELISYHRPENQEERWSDWEAYPLKDPSRMTQLLGESLGIRGVVRKERTLYRYKNARIHLDRVENLGDFFEIESKADTGDEEARKTMEYLVHNLNIKSSDLIRESYIDMITDKSPRPPCRNPE